MSEPPSKYVPRLLGIIAAVWIVWFLACFLAHELPNNSTTDDTITRLDAGTVILEQWPVLLNPLDYSSGESIDAGWSYFGQRLPFAVTAVLIWLAALTVGHVVCRSALRSIPLLVSERIVFTAGCGMSLLTLWVLACGLAGWLSRGMLLLPITLALLSVGWTRYRSRMHVIHSALTATQVGLVRSEQRMPYGRLWTALFAVIVGVFGFHIFLGGMTPPFDFDVREYHLQGPKEWFQTGQITTLRHNVYTSFPFLSEMVSLAAMVVHQDWWKGAISGKLTLAGFQLLTALAVYGACRRQFGRLTGLLAAVVYISTPWITRISVIAYAEGAISFYLMVAVAASTVALQCTETNSRRRMLVLTGFLAGSAMSSKYPGLVSAVIPIAAAVGFAGFRRQVTDASPRSRLHTAVKELAIYVLGVVIAVGPWMLRNTVSTGNPVYPLAYGVFGGADWNAEMDLKWKRAHSAPDHRVSDIPDHLKSVAVANDWQNGLLFALCVPTLVLTVSRPWLRRIWILVGWILLTWWGVTHRIDRFWVPVIPLLAVLAAAVWEMRHSFFWRLFIVVVVCLGSLFNYGFCRLDIVGFHAGLMDMQQARHIPIRRDIRLLNQTLPPSARVLMVGEAEVFDAEFSLIYNTVFDDCIFEAWTTAGSGDAIPRGQRRMKSADAIRSILDEHNVTHVYVNWSEILRYRLTYGYTDYIFPNRFFELQEKGVLEPPIAMSTGDWNSRSIQEQTEVLSWQGGTRLRDGSQWHNIQLYRVRRRTDLNR